MIFKFGYQVIMFSIRHEDGVIWDIICLAQDYFKRLLSFTLRILNANNGKGYSFTERHGNSLLLSHYEKAVVQVDQS